MYEYSLSVPSDSEGTSYNIVADYTLNSDNVDKINIYGNGYFQFGYSTSTDAQSASTNYTLFDQNKYANETNDIFRATNSLITNGAKYLVIKAYPQEHSTFASVRAKYTNASNMYFSKSGQNSATAEDDIYFSSENNVFVYSIRDWTPGSDVNYMQYNTEITLVFTSDTWRNPNYHTTISATTITKNGISKVGYHVTTPKQLAYIASTPSISQGSASENTIIYIDSDINMSAHLWLPLRDFRGQIISEKYKISGLRTTGQANIMLNSSLTIDGTNSTPSYVNSYNNEYTYTSSGNTAYYNYNVDSSMSLLDTTNGATIEGLVIDDFVGTYYNSKNKFNGSLIGSSTNTTTLDTEINNITYSSVSSLASSSNYYFAKFIGKSNGFNVIKNSKSTGSFACLINGANINASFVIGQSNCNVSDKSIVTDNGISTNEYLSNISITGVGNRISGGTNLKLAGLISNYSSSSTYAQDIYFEVTGDKPATTNVISNSDLTTNTTLIYHSIFSKTFFATSTNTEFASSNQTSNFAIRWSNPTTTTRKLKIDSTYSTFTNVDNHTGGTSANNPKIYAISNKNDLLGHLNNIDSSKSFVELRLTQDIDFGYSVWPTVDIPSGYTFNGAGYKISNIVLNNYSRDTNSYAMFGTNAGVIKNLYVNNIYMSVGIFATYKPSNYALIVSNNTGEILSTSVHGTIDANINNSDSNEVYIGGLIGTNSQNLYELEFVGTINVGTFGKNTTSPKYVGGIVGFMNGGALSKVHSSATINTYGNKTRVNNSSYFGGLVGKHTNISVNNSYYGNYANSEYIASINEFEKTSNSKAYALSGTGTGLEINCFYSSANFSLASANGVTSGTSSGNGIYMLNGTFSSVPTNITNGISETNLKNKTGLNGFDFVNVWYYQTIEENHTYPYPMLIGNKNTHDVKVELSVEGIDFTNENITSAFELENDYGYEQIIYGVKDEHTDTTSIKNAIDYYVQVLHRDSIDSTKTNNRIKITPKTNYHIVSIVVDGVPFLNYNYRNNPTSSTTAISTDYLNLILSNTNYSGNQKTYARTNNHTIKIVLSKNYNFLGTGINGTKMSRDSITNTISNEYGTMTVSYTTGNGKTNMLKGNSGYYNHSLDNTTYSTWYLPEDLHNYYYQNTSGFNAPNSANSLVSFTFESTPRVGDKNSYVATRLIGWVYETYASANSSSRNWETIKNASLIKYKFNGDGTIGYEIVSNNDSLNYAKNITNFIDINSSTIQTSEIGMSNGKVSSKYITKATLTVTSDKVTDGYYYPVVEYIYTSSVVTALHYHNHLDSCYNSNGELICTDDVSHPFDYTSTCTTGGNTCLNSNNVTIQNVDTSSDITPGDILSEGSRVRIQIQNEKQGSLIGKFARRFYDTSTNSLQIYYYEIEEQTIKSIYKLNGNSKVYFDESYVDEANGVFDVSNSRLVTVGGSKEYQTRIEFTLTRSTTNVNSPVNTDGEYAFYMIEKLYDFTFNIFDADRMSETHFEVSKESVFGNAISIKNENGVLKYSFGSENNYANIPSTMVSKLVSVMGRTLKVSVMLSGNDVIITSQMPDGHVAKLVSTTLDSYRLTDQNDSIVAKMTNKDVTNQIKYTSYQDVKHTETDKLGIRDKAYLSYKLAFNLVSGTSTKTYTYDYGTVTIIDEKVDFDIKFAKDYYSYFDQFGIDTNIPNYYTSNLSGSSTASTKFNNTTPIISSGQPTLSEILNSFQFATKDSNITSGEDGLTKNTAFTINSPYKLGWLAHILNNNPNETYKVNGVSHKFKDAYYKISNNLNMSSKFWLPIAQFDGVMFSLNDALDSGSISNIKIELKLSNVTGSFDTTNDTNSNHVGLIAKSNNAKFVGLNLNNFDINTDLAISVGNLVGLANSCYFDNINVRNSVICNIKNSSTLDSIAVGGMVGRTNYMFAVNQTEITGVNFATNHNNVSAVVGASDYFGEIYNTYAFVNRITTYKSNTGITTSNPTIKFVNANNVILKNNVHFVSSGVANSDLMFANGNILDNKEFNYLVGTKTVADATSVASANVNITTLNKLDSRVWANNSDNTDSRGTLKLISTAFDMSTTSTSLSTTEATNKGTIYNPYLIQNAQDFVLFVNNMNSNSNNTNAVYYKLTADIDLSGKYINPIVLFKANLDGNNHKISGFYLYSDMGLTINGQSYFDSALILENQGKIENLFVVDFHIVNSNLYVANNNTFGTSALVARNTNSGLVRNVSVVADIISTSEYTSGVVAINTSKVSTIISNGNILGLEYVSGVIGKSTTGSESTTLGNHANILGYKHIGGVIASAETINVLKDMYNVGTLIISDDGSSSQSVAGVINSSTNAGLTISNIYISGSIKLISNISTPTIKVAPLVISFAGGNITLRNSVWLSSVINNLGSTAYSTDKAVVTTGTTTLESVASKTSNEIIRLSSTFPEATWDYVNVWSVYTDINGGLPVFKQFNDYIVKLPHDANHTIGYSNDLLDRYFTYVKPDTNTRVMIHENYIVDIDNSETNIQETGLQSMIVSLRQVVINEDGTIYIYKGATVTLRVTSIIYRHVTTITLGHESSQVENITNTYSRTDDVQDKDEYLGSNTTKNYTGKKLGVRFDMLPSASVLDMYDRNRFDYFVNITEDIDTYDISAEALETTDDTSVRLIDKITISDTTNNKSASNTNPTLQSIPHGSRVKIELSLNPTIIGYEYTNIRVDYWMLEVDNILTDNSGYNYLLDNKTIVNSLETSDNKFELNKLYNKANYTMFETNGSTKTSQYSISNGKISIEFVATAETSGNYVISLIKQWLVQVKFKITTDIGFDYPVAYVNGYENVSAIEKAILETGDSQVKSAYQINQKNLGDKDNNNTISTQSYNLNYYAYSNGVLATRLLDAGIYQKESTNYNYNDTNNLTNKDYMNTTFTAKMFVDHNASINFSSYSKETYTFTGFTTKSGSNNVSLSNVTNTIVVGGESLELYTYRIETLTHAFYGDSMIVANYIPSKHYINTIVDKGGELEYNTENGVVSAPSEVPSTVSTTTLTGTNITSEVRHGTSITISLLPNNKYVYDKCCIRYYIYKDVENNGTTTRIYYNQANSTWQSNTQNILDNYLPVVQKYVNGVLADNKTTLKTLETTYNVESNGATTGDTNYSYELKIDNVVGNIELHVNYVRYYWNDKPTTSTLQGGGTKTNPYRISKASDWGYIVNTSNATNEYYKDKYFMVTNDIDFASRFTPTLNKFAGNIFGNGYTFNNILLDSHRNLGITTRHASGVAQDSEYIYGMSEFDSTTRTTKYGLINTLETSGLITGLKFAGLNIIASENNNFGSNKSTVALVSENNGKLDNIQILSDADNSSLYLIENNPSLSSSSGAYTVTFGGIVGVNKGIISNSINNATLNYSIDTSSNNQSITQFGGIAGANYGQIINTKNFGSLSYIKNSLNFVANKDKLIQGISFNIDTNAKDVLVYNVVSLGTISNTTNTNVICNNVGNVLNAYSSADYPEFISDKTLGYATLGINNYSSSTTVTDFGLWIEKAGVESITLSSLKKTIGTSDYYILENALHLAWLSRATTYNNAELQGKTFVIASATPIDLSGRYFTPINSGYNNSFNLIGIAKNKDDILTSDLLEDADVENVKITGLTIESNSYAGIYNASMNENSIYSAFINTISNSTIRGLDFENVDILTFNSGAVISGLVGGTSNITNCNYISGNIFGYNNKLITNRNTLISGLVGIIKDTTNISASTVTGYVNGTQVLHESYEFGNDLGGNISSLNNNVYASGMVSSVNDNAILEQSYFNGTIEIYNTDSSHSGYVNYLYGSVQNNYVKGKIISHFANTNIAGLVYEIYGSANIINNYVALDLNLTSGNAYVLGAISTGASGYNVSKNYYLVDSSSTPNIGQGIQGTPASMSGTVASNVIQISSSSLRNQKTFKNDSTWDFDDIWIYINHINWDYPVLRSIYGGDTTDIEVTIYNPYKYSDDTNQLGNLNLDNNDILFRNSDNKVESIYGNIENSTEFSNTTELKFTYSIITNEVGNFIISNTSTGLITSTLFGELQKAGTEVGGVTLTKDQSNYQEYADTLNNADIVISQTIDKVTYGLVITFNERVFNVTINSTLTADVGTDGVQDSDYMTVLLVHKNSAGEVDHAYSINLRNNQSYTFENIYNGEYDIVSQNDGRDVTTDSYGTYDIYVFYPMFYLNSSAHSYVTVNQNVSHNPTLDANYLIASYTQYTTIETISTQNCSINAFGSFNLDTITRDVEISITLNKPYEYWLHESATNM